VAARAPVAMPSLCFLHHSSVARHALMADSTVMCVLNAAWFLHYVHAPQCDTQNGDQQERKPHTGDGAGRLQNQDERGDVVCLCHLTV
jgi:hypothetical protein